MKKYIVDIQFKNKEKQIVTLKAKNNLDLEIKVAQDIVNIFDNIYVIDYIEYVEIKRYYFSKRPYWFVGDTLVGSEALKRILKNKGDFKE